MDLAGVVQGVVPCETFEDNPFFGLRKFLSFNGSAGSKAKLPFSSFAFSDPGLQEARRQEFRIYFETSFGVDGTRFVE
jgi:hypothetical protein